MSTKPSVHRRMAGVLVVAAATVASAAQADIAAPWRVKCYDSVIEQHRADGSEQTRISPDDWNRVVKGYCEHTELPAELRGEPYQTQGGLGYPPGGGP